MIGEEKLFAIGSTRVAVSTIVCTTEGCIDSMSPTRRFLRGGAKFGGHELVDSPDESSLSCPEYLGLFLVRFVALVRVFGNVVVGTEGDDKSTSC